MPAPLPIRADRSPAEPHRPARRRSDGRVSARLLALANALDGLPRAVEAQRLTARLPRGVSGWVAQAAPAP